MVGVDVETVAFADLTQLKIKGYHFDENVSYNTKTVSYTKDGNEDDFIEFTMVPEFDALGYEKGEKGVVMTITERCSVAEMLHFPAAVSFNALQAFLNRKFNN